MMRVSVSEVLGICSSAYRTIDVRLAIVRNGGQWVSGFAAIRLSHEKPSVVRGMHAELLRRHGSVQTDQFAIITTALPFAAWSEICAEVGAGSWRVGGVDVRISPIEIGALTGYVHRARDGSFLRDPEAWPAANFATGDNQGALLTKDEIVRAVSGYQSPYQAIAALCGAETWPRMNHGYSVLLRLPIYAALRQVRIQAIDQTLRASARLHRIFKGVVLNVIATDGSSGVPKGRTTIKLGNVPAGGGEIQELNGSSALPSMNEDDFVETSIWHPAFGELDRHNASVRDLLPRAVRNLLLEVLKHFCTVEQFQDLLTKPNDHSDRKGDQSTAFERHVGWLLSLAGFSPIALGNLEHMKVGRGQRATVDIIAARGMTLLLVACTIGAPKAEDLSTLLHLRRVLSEKLDEQANVNVVAVLVSGTTVTEQYHRVENEVGIPIIDTQQLREITASLSDLTTASFLKLLTKPDSGDMLIPFGTGSWQESE